MSVLNWARQIVEGSTAASPFATYVNLATLPAGSTIRRSIVTFDWWTNSTTAEFVEVGLCIAYGLSIGTSSATPDYKPFTDWAATGPKCPNYYLDQMGTIEQFAYDVAGTIQYIVKNDTTSRHIDTRAQRKNTSASAEYVWFGIQPDPAGVGSFSDTYWSVASQILYESPS
jgi:hypothetical protein